MRTKNTNNFKKVFSFLVLLFVLFLQLPAHPVTASDINYFGVSGPFSNYHYKMVLGESLDTPLVYVQFYNGYQKDIKVKLLPDTPAGVTMHISEDLITIPKNDVLRVPIGLTVSNDAAPAPDYIIGLAAQVIPDELNGIAIIGSALLRTKLTIFGEAGKVTINTISLNGSPFAAVINIYRIEGDQLIPVAYSADGTLAEKLIPGRYAIVATYNGKVVARQEVNLQNGDDFVITLTAKTVFIPTFLVGPQFDAETKKFTSAKIAYTIENSFEPINQVRITLNVLFEEDGNEQVDVLLMDTLQVMSFNSQYYFIPSGGWRKGTYYFRLDVFQENESGVREDALLLTQSIQRDVYIDVQTTTIDPYIIYIGIGSALFLFLIIGIIFLFFGQKPKKCEELMKQAEDNLNDYEKMVLSVESQVKLNETPDWKLLDKLQKETQKAIKEAANCPDIKPLQERFDKAQKTCRNISLSEPK